MRNGNDPNLSLPRTSPTPERLKMKTTMYRVLWRHKNGTSSARGGLTYSEADACWRNAQANPRIAELEMREIEIGDGPTKSTVIKTWQREMVKEKR